MDPHLDDHTDDPQPDPELNDYPESEDEPHGEMT